MRKRKKSWFIDIGEALTKVVVAIIADSGEILIKDVRIAKTPGQLWPAANASPQLKARRFLRPLLRGYRRDEEVVLLINHRHIVVGTFTFPMMTISELEEVVSWQLELLIEADREAWRIDFVAHEKNQWLEYLGMDNKELQVLGVAIEKRLLAGLVKIFRDNGCCLTTIVPHFYPMDILFTLGQNQTGLIIEIGKKWTRFFYFEGDTLKEYQQLGLETTWDGEMYLQQIVKMSERVILSPTVDGKNGAHQKIYLMGGESLHPGVLEYLTKWLRCEIIPCYRLLEKLEELVFPEPMSPAELCLIAPCLCSMIKKIQLTRRGAINEA